MPGARREKVADLVRDETARILQTEIHDDRVGFVTVTGVRMSPDLRHARIFVSILAEGSHRDEAMRALCEHKSLVRRRLGQTLRLRHTPDLVFSLDTSLEYGSRIERMIEDIHHRDAPRAADDPGFGEPAGAPPVEEDDASGSSGATGGPGRKAEPE